MKTLLLVLLVAATGQDHRSCNDCRMEAGDAVLCAPHRDEEDAAFERWERRLDSEEWKERFRARVWLAGLTYEHVNAPSRRVAEALVTAFEEPLEYRIQATLLVHRWQHPDVVVPVLVEELDRCMAEFDALCVTWKEDYLMSPGRKRRRKSKEPSEGIEIKTGLYLPPHVSMVIVTLGTYPDERSRAALVRLLEREPVTQMRPVVEPACLLLIGFGDPESLKAVTDYQTRLEKALRKGPLLEDEPVPSYGGLDLLRKLYGHQLDPDPPNRETLRRNYELFEERARELGFTEIAKRDHKGYLMARNWRT